MLWGLGHTVAILLAGGAIVVFKFVMPPRLGLAMELAVGLMLVALGGWNLANGGDLGHEPTSKAHDHDRGHIHSSVPGLGGALGSRATRPLIIGIVHGLAGSAAVALLVLGTIERPVWAMAYLFVFGVGTIAGMMLITTVLATPFVFAAGRFTRLHRGLGIIAGLLSVTLGASMIYEIGFVHGLFTSHPDWTPH